MKITKENDRFTSEMEEEQKRMLANKMRTSGRAHEPLWPGRSRQIVVSVCLRANAKKKIKYRKLATTHSCHWPQSNENRNGI